MAFLLVIATAYLLGSIPFGLLLTRLAGLGDIRNIGSGNIGATNVLRTGNRKLAALTLLLDGLKGYLAVAAAVHILLPYTSYQDAQGVPHIDYVRMFDAFIVSHLIVPVAAVAGHVFPVWLKFRGGKGVATTFGVALAMSPIIGGIGLAAWLAVFALTRTSSMAALISVMLMPLVAASGWVLAANIFAPPLLAIALLVTWRHKENIRRLASGTEPRFGKDKPGV